MALRLKRVKDDERCRIFKKGFPLWTVSRYSTAPAKYTRRRKVIR
jgi:hypothetical protein